MLIQRSHSGNSLSVESKGLIGSEQLRKVPFSLRRELKSVKLSTWSLVKKEFEKLLTGESNREIRIESYYLPLFCWIDYLYTSQFLNQSAHPMIIGVNGPQGCGKSTLTGLLTQVAAQVGLRAITLSIDDFYLTREQQIQLARKYPDQPFLQQRGYPGTHDIELGVKVLKALRLNSLEKKVALPSFDKSLHQGRGDRIEEKSWREVVGPYDWIFLEGWMLGFSPVREDQLPHSDFFLINRFLESYKIWHSFLDVFIQLKPNKIDFISEWRVEAEQRMKALGKPAMTVKEITDYIQTFIPAYRLYLPLLSEHPPVESHFLCLQLLRSRIPF